MIIGYITETNIYTSFAEQKEMISRYAEKYSLGNVRFVKIPKEKSILSYSMKENDTFIISDVSLLGARFEDIMHAVKLLSEHKVKIFSIKENLVIDAFSPHLLEENVDTCLKLYKGIFSLRNTQIQRNLLTRGKSRGRPVGTGKSGLEEKIDEIKSLLSHGTRVSEIADMLGICRGTLYMFIKRRKLKV